MIDVLASLMISTVIGARDPEANVMPASRLTLEIESTKTTMALYEPLSLRCKVRNPTHETITANIHLSPDSSRVPFFVTAISEDNAEEREYRASRIVSAQILDETVHEPGSIVSAVFTLRWSQKAAPFPTPGTYRVRAVLYAGSRPDPVNLHSNSVDIQVREPEGVDAQAIAFFGSTDDFEFLLSRGVRRYCEERNKFACYDQLRQFAEQYPASVYAPDVLWQLADAVANGLLESGPQAELGIELYGVFLKHWPSHPAAPRVMYSLILTLDRAGRHSEATAKVAEFERQYPEETTFAMDLRTNFLPGEGAAPSP